MSNKITLLGRGRGRERGRGRREGGREGGEGGGKGAYVFLYFCVFFYYFFLLFFLYPFNQAISHSSIVRTEIKVSCKLPVTAHHPHCNGFLNKGK
jgi:hypothetical protein